MRNHETQICESDNRQIKLFLLLRVLGIIFILNASGCIQKDYENPLDNAAADISGVFMTEDISSPTSLRVKGQPSVKNAGDTIFNIYGIVEEFTSFNVPVRIDHFKESVRYLGGDPKDKKNWTCIEIFISDKKFK